MPTRQPPCPRCNDNLYVRAEKVLSGFRITQAYYCGRCNHEWVVPADGRERDRRPRVRPKPDRRQVD